MRRLWFDAKRICTDAHIVFAAHPLFSWVVIDQYAVFNLSFLALFFFVYFFCLFSSKISMEQNAIVFTKRSQTFRVWPWVNFPRCFSHSHNCILAISSSPPHACRITNEIRITMTGLWSNKISHSHAQYMHTHTLYKCNWVVGKPQEKQNKKKIHAFHLSPVAQCTLLSSQLTGAREKKKIKWQEQKE